MQEPEPRSEPYSTRSSNSGVGSFFRAPDGSLPFLRFGTLVLITFLSTTSQYFVLWPWYSSTATIRTTIHLGVFNVAILFIYWTFYLACRDPGSVDPQYVPADDTDARYCKRCESFKPPRSHHCRRCGRCILRMDHHCPWLSSCVGYSNHAAFIKFLSWVVPTTGYLAIMMGARLYEFLNDHQSPAIQSSEIILMVLNLIGASAVCLMTACLHFYQLWCAIENITTIESWNKSRVEALIRKKKIVPIDFPYDLYTIKENLREIMGHHNPLLWLWPPSGATGTGHEFPVNEDADLSRTWPPKDPDAVMESQTSAAKIRPLLEGEEQPIVEAEIVDSWDEYAEAGLIAESDASEDDYANEEGEYLDSYGVDDEDETSALEELVGADLTLGQLLSKRRSIKIEAVAQKYADSRKTR